MTLTIDLTPTEEARLEAAARQEGVTPGEVVRKIVSEHLPTVAVEGAGPSPENAAAIALLTSWLAEEATDDPEQIRRAEEELVEFKHNLNGNRAATGERLLFPE